MQLIVEDSDINSMKYGGNVSDEITQNLRSPINAELNGVINGDINQSVPPNQTELKGDYSGLINANQNSAFSDPNSQENTTNKRNRDEDMDQSELPSKKLQVSMAESQKITMVEAARQPRQDE